jgi:tetratricopeptide (TPR) repeat protein
MAWVGLLGFVLLWAMPARGFDFVRESIPSRWVDQVMPEDLPPLEYPAYFNDLDKARAQVFHGRYRTALFTLNRLKGRSVESSLIRMEALAALGRHKEALKVADEAGVIDDERVAVLKAVVLGQMGKLELAVETLRKTIEQHPQSIAAHYQLGTLLEQAGDLEGAKKVYSWFNEPPQRFFDRWIGGVDGRDAIFESAENVVLIGRALDRLATLTGAYQNNRKLHDVILGMFIRAYDVIDRQYWPAHVAAAEYFLGHDDQENALKELKIAQQANPFDSDSLQLLGKMAVEGFNFDGADLAIATMRKVNPTSSAADLLEARNLLRQRRPADAEPCLHRVLSAQPKNLETLGLLAAVRSLQLRDEESAGLIQQVETIDPDNASAYFEVADQLSAMRQYPRAAEMYQKAIDRAPWWTAARNGLGLLYTQSGDEDKAMAVLEAARTLDPFNVRTTNYLRLLDDLSHFARKESAHFIVFYDPATDPVIPEYFNDYLESIYKQVCGTFNHEPAVKTYIEVFPTHDAFSVRTTGSPWIGTVGASTGRVIALVAPRKGKQTMGPFNWAQVLRHEFTHTVTLSATDNRISHWMTEGLAVYQEDAPIPWAWAPMLYQAVHQHELFTMEGLTWGFVRPRRPIDRQLAYAQSFWICSYIEQTYGHQAILRMMEEFRKGQRQDQIILSVLGRDETQFAKEFFVWAKKQVDGWGYDPLTTAKYDQLREEGESLIKSRQYPAALKIWLQIAQLRPMDALPHQRLAGLYLTKAINDPAKALEHLIILHRAELHDNAYAKRIARIYRDMGQLDEACQYGLQAVHIEPYDPSAHELLLGLYEKTNNRAGVDREKRVLGEIEKLRSSAGQAKP